VVITKFYSCTEATVGTSSAKFTVTVTIHKKWGRIAVAIDGSRQKKKQRKRKRKTPTKKGKYLRDINNLCDESLAITLNTPLDDEHRSAFHQLTWISAHAPP
jgi:hypothetical protein